MKKIIPLLLLFILSVNCKPILRYESNSISIHVDTILKETISIRALTIDKNKLWFAGTKNRFGYYDLKKNKLVEHLVKRDSLNLEFRSIAQNSNFIFLSNIGNPAYIFKIDKKKLSSSLVYFESNNKVFYDSMNFWNEEEGIAIGDPTEDCLSVLITRDSGQNWKKVSCENLPKVVDGEAAFAASNTNICIKGYNTWIVSGGVKSRIFYSPDKGISWNVFNVPIVQGKAMTGIFTADFFDANLGIVAGGDYEIPNQDFQNKAITKDGGKTWQRIAENTGFGYASCIQFVPKSRGNAIVAVGALGIHYSQDAGKTWRLLSNDNTLYTIRFIDKHTAYAAGKDKIIKITFK